IIEFGKERVSTELTSKDSVVHGAIIEFGKERVSTELTSKDSIIQFTLHSPFEKGRIVGHLSMVPERAHIRLRAKEIGRDNAKALVMQAAVATTIAITIMYLLITQPMIFISQSLHKVRPGTDERLSIPDFHQNSELGGLVTDINNLLNNTQQQLSAEQALKDELKLLEKRFRMIFESSQSPIILMEPRGSILLYNHAFSSLLNKINLEIKKSFGTLLSELFKEPATLLQDVRVAFANDEISTGEYQLISDVKEKPIWVQVVVNSIVSEDMKEYYQLTLHDISKRKKELEKLNLRANFDQMTQLLNRHAGEKKINNLIYSQQEFVVILLDLNGFKEINDQYGHDCGDEILINVASILKNSVRHDDFSCRWGGDEFVVILKDVDKDAIRLIAHKLLLKIQEPYFLSEQQRDVIVGASIGAAFHPQDNVNMLGLMQMADKAMYHSKKNRAAGDELDITFADEVIHETP
ncbi:MAG: sensor domain-containing diguanylate cyclase, partial [Bermanella sp.]